MRNLWVWNTVDGSDILHQFKVLGTPVWVLYILRWCRVSEPSIVATILVALFFVFLMIFNKQLLTNSCPSTFDLWRIELSNYLSLPFCSTLGEPTVNFQKGHLKTKKHVWENMMIRNLRIFCMKLGVISERKHILRKQHFDHTTSVTLLKHRHSPLIVLEGTQKNAQKPIPTFSKLYSLLTFSDSQLPFLPPYSPYS